jgi:dihydroorotate dehydrogenase
MVAQRSVPLFVKLPPWTCDEERTATLTLAETAADAHVDGLVVANSRPVKHPALAGGRGGLSGAPLFESTVKMVAATRAAIPDSVAIIGCGGISSAEHVWQLISVGASAVQLYTGLVYEGPGLPNHINRGLRRLMIRAGLGSLAEIRGAPMLAPR